MPEQQRIGRKQMIGLFLCSLFVIMYAGPLLRLLPVHARQMGASPSLAGAYLAMVYTGLVVATLVAGWLSDRFQRRKATIIVAGLIASLSLALMSRSDTLWQLSLSTTSTWFFGGITYTLFMILAGLHAGEGERGKVFGLLAMSMPLANVLAAPVAGAVADRWGYPMLLAGYAVFALLIPFTTLILLEDHAVAPQAQDRAAAEPTSRRRQWFSPGFYFLVTATFMMAFVGFVNQLGLSLAMYAQTYSSTQIATTVAAGALVSIPLIFLFSWLSDRIPRTRILITCFLIAGAGTLMLAMASALWQFWIAAMLVAVLTASDSLTNALATDLAPKELVGRGLSFTNSARWMGAVVGLALAGFAIEILGTRTAFLLVFVLVPVSVLLTTQIRRDAAQEGQDAPEDRTQDALQAPP